MLRKTFPLILLAAAMLLGTRFTQSFAVAPDENAATGQTVPGYTGNDPLVDDEPQMWQGRVVEVAGNNLVVKVEGERETFDVSPQADIRRNRKKCDLSALAPRDFVTIATYGEDNRERAKKVRAFSVR